MAKKTKPKSGNGDSLAGKDNSVKVHQRDKIKFDLNIYHRNDFTEKQHNLTELINDKKTNIVFVSGPAGTSKTFVAIYAGLMALNEKKQSDILYLRSAIESASRSLGALPGDILLKVSPYLAPLYDKMEELLPAEQVKQLFDENRISGNVVNFVRGASWNAKYVIVDEAQNMTKLELKTVISRLGRHSKLIICGDPGQSDLKEKSGFLPFFDLFNDAGSKDYGIHCFSFGKEDIVRSKILGYILDKIEGTYTPETHEIEPMFPPQ